MSNNNTEAVSPHALPPLPYAENALAPVVSIKVATLRIPSQTFRTLERQELAEDLSFSPAHSLVDHQPIGGINRARVEIYRHLSEFRHKQNHKQLVEHEK